MTDPFFKHNDKIRRANTPPKEIPEPEQDLAGLIAEYNANVELQEGRLARLWASIAYRQGGQRFVAFGVGRRWTTNDFRTLDRPDLNMGRALDGLTSKITDWNLGE